MKEHEKILKTLANRRRLEILKFLKKNKEANVGEIAEHLKLSFKSTSKHLAILLSVNILEKDQRSLAFYYSLSSKQVPIVKAVLGLI